MTAVPGCKYSTAALSEHRGVAMAMSMARVVIQVNQFLWTKAVISLKYTTINIKRNGYSA